MSRLYFIVLLAVFFVACGDKKADVVQGESSVVQVPQQEPQEVQPEVIEEEEVIEEYQAPKPRLSQSSLKTIYFAFDSFVLSKEMFKVVDANAELLKQYPEEKITLEGNTDAYGSDEYNFALGNKRAIAVKEALIVRGIGGDRIEIVSFGETKPVCTKDNSQKCRQENRRVNFVLQTN